MAGVVQTRLNDVVWCVEHTLDGRKSISSVWGWNSRWRKSLWFSMSHSGQSTSWREELTTRLFWFDLVRSGLVAS